MTACLFSSSAAIAERLPNADAGYSVNKLAIAVVSLHRVLRDIFERQTEEVFFLKAAPGLECQAVFPAMAHARSAGIDRIGLLTK